MQSLHNHLRQGARGTRHSGTHKCANGHRNARPASQRCLDQSQHRWQAEVLETSISANSSRPHASGPCCADSDRSSQDHSTTNAPTPQQEEGAHSRRSLLLAGSAAIVPAVAAGSMWPVQAHAEVAAAGAASPTILVKGQQA